MNPTYTALLRYPGLIGLHPSIPTSSRTDSKLGVLDHLAILNKVATP